MTQNRMIKNLEDHIWKLESLNNKKNL